MDSEQGRSTTKTTIPKLTFNYIENLVREEKYHVFEGTGVTVCCLVVENRHNIIAYAVCANLRLFDEEQGRMQAKRKALQKLMKAEQYLLRQRLHELTTVDGS